MSSSFETDSHKSPETLEREIDAKRASISGLVDSLENRFTPGQLFDQALSYTKGNGGQFFENLGTTLKNNPVPTVLTGLGLAWLAMNQNKPFYAGPPSSGTGHGLGESLSNVADKVRGAAFAVGDTLHSATETVAGKAGHIKQRATSLSQGTSDHLGSTTESLRHSAHDARDQLHTQTAQLKGQFNSALKDQPLVIAAIGIALGAVLGAAIPSSRKEDQLMGSTSDKLTSSVKSKGQEALSAAKETVREHAADLGAGQSAGGNPSSQPKSIQPGKPETDLSAGLGTRS
jgi:ElaB/YqjD/DUF883 family membrane-anchored ribosome-binding protein